MPDQPTTDATPAVTSPPAAEAAPSAASAPPAPTPPVSSTPPAWEPPRPSRAPLVISIAALVLAGCAAALAIWQAMLARQEHVASQRAFVHVAGPQTAIMVNPRVLDYETLIAVNQLKLHATATVTMALKNIAMSYPAADYYGHPRSKQEHEHCESRNAH